MPITQIISGPKTFTFTYNTGVVQYVNKYAMRLSIDTNNTTVTFNDFKNNVFDLDITQITVPTTFATVGELVNFLTGQNIYNSTSEWYHGDSDPDVSFGANSDYFLNRITGDIWNKVAGVWTLINTSATGVTQILKGTASGTDTYTTTISGVTAYNDGDAYLIRFTNGNTTGSTLNINGLGAIDLARNNDGLLIGGDIWAGAEMLCIYNSTTNAFQCIGTSPNSLYTYVTNADSVTLTKGMVVYAFGGTGDRMTVKRANNTSDATSARTVGVVASTSIAANQKGVIIIEGLLDGLSILPTSTYSDGDQLYLAATAGTFTNVKPYAPNHLVYVAIVTTASNGAAGRMYVKVQNGYELDELHNVQAQSPANNDVLYYDLATTQWKTGNVTGTLQNAAADGTTKGVATFTAADFNDNGSGLISIDYTNGQAASGSTKGFLTSTDWTTFNNKGNGTVTSVTGTSPIASSGGTTPAISIQDAAADGTTKGAAAFTAADFNATSGVISIDYTNGQAASSSTKGFLTSADWTTFNNKGNGTVTSVTGTSPIASSGGATPAISIQDAAADGTTKGAATFTAADFNSASGVISIDYTNGQAASGSTKGFLTSADWTTFNNKGSGTVTNVSALTLGTSGTDLSSTVATGTTTPVITLNVPTASATNRGALSAADWTTFNNKISGKLFVSVTNSTAVTGTTANTLADSVLVAANTYVVGDIITVMARAIKTGTVNTSTIRVYVNTSAAIAGGILIATFTTTAAANLFFQVERFMIVKSATNTQVANSSASGNTDNSQYSAASTLNIDWTTDKYFVFAIQNGNNADSTLISGYSVKDY